MINPVEVRDVEGDHFTLGEPERTDLSTLDVVLLRQDPPFDMAYVSSTHMLERIHPKTLVVNDPTEVRNAPEKLFVTHFPELMPPTLITRDRAEIEAFREEFGEIVMKPLYGHGGATVFKTGKGDPNFGSLCDLVAVTKRKTSIDEINNIFRQASKEAFYEGILISTDEELVSSDYIGNAHSCIVDLPLTNVVDEDLIKIVAWYDNEWGYSNRLVELSVDAAKMRPLTKDSK